MSAVFGCSVAASQLLSRYSALSIAHRTTLQSTKSRCKPCVEDLKKTSGKGEEYIGQDKPGIAWIYWRVGRSLRAVLVGGVNFGCEDRTYQSQVDSTMILVFGLKDVLKGNE